MLVQIGQNNALTYTFNAEEKTLTVTGLNLGNIVSIKNVTRSNANMLRYQTGVTVSGGVYTLTFSEVPDSSEDSDEIAILMSIDGDFEDYSDEEILFNKSWSSQKIKSELNDLEEDVLAINQEIGTLDEAVAGKQPTGDYATNSALALKADTATVAAGLMGQGAWNAATNTPTLSATPLSIGKFYEVSVAGTSSVPTGGSIAYAVGDKLVSNGAVWQVVPVGSAAYRRENIDVLDGNVAPLNFTFNSVTGELNSTELVAYYTKGGTRIWVTGGTGVGAIRVTAFKVYDPALPNNRAIVYMDVALATNPVNTTLTGELKANSYTTMPAVPTGSQRIYFGVSTYLSGAYHFYSDMLQVWSETGNNRKPIQVLSDKVNAIPVPSLEINKRSDLNEGYTTNNGRITYDRATGKLNSPDLVTYFVKGGARVFLTGGTGVGSLRITDFQVFDPALPNATAIIYTDIAVPAGTLTNAGITAELKANSYTTMPVIAAGSHRIIFGVSSNFSGAYDFYSDVFQIWDETSTRKRPIQVLKEQVASMSSIVSSGGTNRQKASEPFVNRFPNIWDNTPKFKQKLLAQADDCEVVLLGDSIFALCTSASAITDALPSNVPPSCQYNHVMYNIWKHAVKNKPQYDRYDSAVNTFTELGTWTSEALKWDSPEWTGEFRDGGSLTRQSNTPSASFAFAWNTNSYEKLNLIHRQSTDGVVAATIAVTQGAGKVQVHNGTAWVEANGYVFTQRTATDIQGNGNSLYLANVKLKFRRVSTGLGTVNITVSKGANSDYLYFWGTERWNGASLFFTNVARGGRTVIKLKNNFLNDVIGRKPDLVLFEIPMVNEMSNYAYPATGGWQTIVNNVQDFIYGDRAGFETDKNLKFRTNNFQDIEVVACVPHYRKDYLSGNRFINYTFDGLNNADSTAFATYTRVKNLIHTKGGISVIDMAQMFLSEAENLGWTYEQAFTPSSQTSDLSFTTDTVHENDFGAYLWAKYLAPIFDIA